MISNRYSVGASALMVVWWLVSATVAFGQALPQLQNGIRNTFSEGGEPADPEPPGPTARTGNQFQSGTAHGGWQATRVLEDGQGFDVDALHAAIVRRRPSSRSMAGR